MAISMYQASAPLFTRMLTSLALCLDKAEKFCEDKKVDPGALLNARLYPDMFHLIKQVQIATDMAKGGIARLAGQEPPVYEDAEKSFADLAARIQKTIAFINGFKPEQIDGTEDKDITLKMRAGETKFKGLAYLQHFVYGNLYFHVTTTYAILRHNGVEVGKRDFLGPY
jgi:uncharacterized protein